MKKTFSFITHNKNPERQSDSIKHEIKKYLGRERRKTLPEGVDFWDFDCRIGPNETDTVVVEAHEINSNISRLLSNKNESFYVEILAKAGYKRKKA